MSNELEVEWLDTRQAAEILGLRHNWVAQLCQTGQLKAEMRQRPDGAAGRGQQYYVPRAEVERYKNRPRSCADPRSRFITREQAAEILDHQVETIAAYFRNGTLTRIPFAEVPKEERTWGCWWYASRAEVEALRHDGKRRHSTRRSVIPTTPTDTEWATLAGFFSGEGCVQINRTHCGFGMHIMVVNTDFAALEWIKSRFGGDLRAKTRSATHRKDQKLWRVSAGLAAVVLKGMRPYLLCKQQQADIAIAFQERVDSMHHSPWNPMTAEETLWRSQQKELVMALNRPNLHLKVGP